MAAFRLILYWVFGALAALVIAVLLTIYAVSEWELARVYPLKPETAVVAGPETIEEGRRWAKLYGCTSCHGADLRGHVFNKDPWLVRNLAPNLTLLTREYSDAQFAQAIKQGVRPSDGRAMWGMPSQIFATLTDEELGPVLALIRAQPPGGEASVQPSPSLQSRLAIVINAFQPSNPTEQVAIRPAPELVALALQHPPADLGPGLARGRHLVATVCSECHGSDLKGEATEGGPDLIVAGGYDRAAFQKLLRTGKSLSGRDLGIMSEVARDDFVVFTDDEINAIYDYLVARAAQQH